MEDIKINSEELKSIDNGQDVSQFENYSTSSESVQSIICGCMQFAGRSGRTYTYRGIASGCVRAVFSRNGRVTSISGNVNILPNRIYNFTHLPGEQVGFQCC